MNKIVSFKICPCFQRISALFEAVGVPYQAEFLNLNHIPKWFTDISPNLEPVLITEDGKSIPNLYPILQYLLEKHKEEISSLDLRYFEENDEWCKLADQQYINQCVTMRSNDLGAMIEKGKEYIYGLHQMEMRLADDKFFQGDTLSLVDIAWIPVLHRAALVKDRTGYDFLDAFPGLQRWQGELMDTQIPQNSVSIDFLAVFEEYYLNSSTYLGKLQNKSGRSLHYLCCKE
ncbi:glutathione S-transferase family protein [Puteibacter caeruleilacunae]|nr:glutathione S-transferase family protein [Puteibacter caeruleilacunae]